MSIKPFKDKLEKELNILGSPTQIEERKKAFAKVFRLSKHTASSILNGLVFPDRKTLEKLASEMDVSVEWLLGESESKK